MYGLTRGTVTLVGAACAGLLIWIATQVGLGTTGGYWAVVALIAGAGFVIALSQLLGGWTKWGWPRVSASVFLFAFIPTLVAAGWVLLAAQPQANWLQRHFNDWSSDIGIDGLVRDLGEFLFVLAFGLGLVFGLIFDTTGPRAEPVFRRRRGEAAPPPAGPPGRTTTETEAERRRSETEATETEAERRRSATEAETPPDETTRRS
jgi:hypothetical protein